MFEIVLDSAKKGVQFSRTTGRISFRLAKPIYFNSSWVVAVTKIFCTHNLITVSNENPIYVSTDFIESKMSNNGFEKILMLLNIENTEKSCFCRNSQMQPLSFCQVSVTEVAEIMIYFRNNNGESFVFNDNFNFVLVLSFQKQ